MLVQATENCEKQDNNWEYDSSFTGLYMSRTRRDYFIVHFFNLFFSHHCLYRINFNHSIFKHPLNNPFHFFEYAAIHSAAGKKYYLESYCGFICRYPH
jgi:hypothetical protein